MCVLDPQGPRPGRCHRHLFLLPSGLFYYLENQLRLAASAPGVQGPRVLLRLGHRGQRGRAQDRALSDRRARRRPHRDRRLREQPSAAHSSAPARRRAGEATARASTSSSPCASCPSRTASALRGAILDKTCAVIVSHPGRGWHRHSASGLPERGTGASAWRPGPCSSSTRCRRAWAGRGPSMRSRTRASCPTSTSSPDLGGGVPIGAMLANEEVGQGFEPGSHASTFGGNPAGDGRRALRPCPRRQRPARELPRRRRVPQPRRSCACRATQAAHARRCGAAGSSRARPRRRGGARRRAAARAFSSPSRATTSCASRHAAHRDQGPDR